MSGTVVTGLAGNVDAAEQSSFNKKRPREQDDEVRRKASSAISDEDGEELVSADSAYPPSRIKALVDDFRWIPVDPIRLKEFVTLKQWITNESLRQKNTEAMTQQGVRCSVDPAGGCTKNGNEIKEDIRIISRRECKRQLHVPLLSMVLNKIPKGRAPSRLSCPGGMDYPYTTVPKKADSLEWSGRCVLISSTEGRLLSFNGRLVGLLCREAHRLSSPSIGGC